MKNSSNLRENFVERFSVAFLKLNCEHRIEEIIGNVNVFIMQFENEKELDSHWKEIRNLIAVHYQSILQDEFERWNIYLVFVLPEIVHKELKYKIENDQLSSRKIVIDRFKDVWNDKAVMGLLNNYILNKISLPDEDVALIKLGNYYSKSPVYELVNKMGEPNKKRDKEGVKVLYQAILDKLRDEN